MLEPVAQDMIAQAKGHRSRFKAHHFALDTLRGSLGLTNETSKQIERFSYINAFEQEDMQLSISVQRTWRAALEALKTDADAELPG